MDYIHTSILSRISEVFPFAIYHHPNLVRPLSDEAFDSILNTPFDNISRENIRKTLQKYKWSRAYNNAIAKNTCKVDASGFQCTEPNPEEVSWSRKWLDDWSIESCLSRLRDPQLCLQVKKKTRAILEQDFREQATLAKSCTRGCFHSDALIHSKLAYDIKLAIHDVFPHHNSDLDINHSKFRLHFCEYQVRLFEANFAGARKAVGTMIDIVEQVPRYATKGFFSSDADLHASDSLINAMESFKNGQFTESKVFLEIWLEKSGRQHLQGDGRTNSARFAILVSRLLSEIHLDNISMIGWEELNTFVDSVVSVPLTMGAFHKRLVALRASHLDFQKLSNSSLDLFKASVAELWQYISLECPLKGEDRAANQDRSVVVPSFLDVLNVAATLKDKCAATLIRYNLRHALQLRLDYATKINASRPGTIQYNTTDIEKMATSDLYEAVQKERCSKLRTTHQIARFSQSMEYWRQANDFCHLNDIPNALHSSRYFFDQSKFLPHVVEILECRNEKYRGICNPDIERRFGFRLKLRRLWNKEPTILTLRNIPKLECPSKDLLYLRPRWNMITLKEKRWQRGYYIVTSGLPVWMRVFEKWASGRGPVPAERFLSWLNHVDERMTASCCRLLSRFTYFSLDDIREIWRKIFDEHLRHSLKPDTIFVPLGRSAKSGQMQLYLIKQALTELLDLDGVVDPKRAFMSWDEVKTAGAMPRSIIFIDDLSGSGEQAIDYLGETGKLSAESSDCEIKIAFVAAFKDAIEAIQGRYPSLKNHIYCGRLLTDADRAFHEENPLWDSADERIEVMEWCRSKGEELVKNILPDAEMHALGWRNTQALVAFEYNIPNNTLPIFWASSEESGSSQWQNLFDRY